MVVLVLVGQYSCIKLSQYRISVCCARELNDIMFVVTVAMVGRGGGGQGMLNWLLSRAVSAGIRDGIH